MKNIGTEISHPLRGIYNSDNGLLSNKFRFIEHAFNSGVTFLKARDALESVMNIISEVFQADACSLFLYRSEIDKLEFVVAYGIKALEFKYSKIAPGQGICGWVYKNRKPILSNDVLNDKRFDDPINLELDFNKYNIIAAPLMIKGKCLGVVEVINRRSENLFTSKQIKLLKALSNKVAVLVENEQLFDRCCQQLHQRNTMLDLAREVNTARELPDLLNFIVITVAELLNSEASSLLLKEGNLLRFEIAFGEKGTEVKKYTVPLGSGIAGSVAISGKSTIINKANAKDSGIFKEIDKKTGFTTRNLIAVPLRVKDRIIGVVEVVNRRDTEGFSKDDISLLEGFANEAAIAIERAQITEKRIQAERLATIGRTVADLTHSIKNITNALKGGEYIVDKGFRDNKMEIVKKGWEITKQGSERIRELVLDMLTISKKREPEFTTCNPHDIVTEVIEIFEEKAKEKNVKIESKFDKDISLVRIDRKNIFRCLVNLISNALDASMEKKGIIRIETFKKREKPFFGFCVIDNGCGISEEDKKKLFHEFFSTKGSQGTGLGLSVTHAIVSEHGGNIKCDSQLGKGTSFTIELPIGM